MSLTSIDSETLARVILCGANNLSNNKEYINELNVFPVPDGDTGTNMTLTIMSAAAEIKALSDRSMDKLAKAISGGSLRGARGNSGVILSQLFRGFCKDIKGKESLSVEDVTSAFSRAVDTAYKAVMKPKEGTILTVARGIAEKAAELCDTEDDLISFGEEILKHGEAVLKTTPDLLPVLKEAGVVDSGGQGLVEIIRGIVAGLKGEDIELKDAEPSVPMRGAGLLEEIPSSKPAGSGNDNISTADIKYAYCTEFIIMLDKELSDDEVEKFKDYLLSLGDSLVCVADEELVKVHVHTNHPGLAFEKALTYGSLTRMKIDNMKEEHNERVLIEAEKQKALEQEAAFRQMKQEKEKAKAEAGFETAAPVEERKPYGFVAVCAGDGLANILSELGIDHVIHGGQTMNPSTDDILSAVEKVNADTVFVFPNNKNIILAANQAAGIEEDKKIIVIPTTTVPQSISAIINFDPDADAETNEAAFKDSISMVKSGEITYAVRDTSVDGKEIHKDDIMGIGDKGIDVVGKDVDEVTAELVGHMIDENSGLISVYYGEDISSETAEQLADKLRERFPDVDVDLHEGGQPVYYYIVSVE